MTWGAPPWSTPPEILGKYTLDECPTALETPQNHLGRYSISLWHYLVVPPQCIAWVYLHAVLPHIMELYLLTMPRHLTPHLTVSLYLIVAPADITTSPHFVSVPFHCTRAPYLAIVLNLLSLLRHLLPLLYHVFVPSLFISCCISLLYNFTVPSRCSCLITRVPSCCIYLPFCVSQVS